MYVQRTNIRPVKNGLKIECPFSGVTKSATVWRKVPESDDRGVPESDVGSVPETDARGVPESDARSVPESDVRSVG